MKRLSDLVDSPDKDTARAARVLRAYGALSLPLASRQRVREAISAPTSSVPPHLARRAALGLAMAMAALLGIQIEERAWGPQRRSTTHNRRPQPGPHQSTGPEVQPDDPVISRPDRTGSSPSPDSIATWEEPTGDDGAHAAPHSAIAGEGGSANPPGSNPAGNVTQVAGVQGAGTAGAGAVTERAPVLTLSRGAAVDGAAPRPGYGGSRGGERGAAGGSAEGTPLAASPTDEAGPGNTNGATSVPSAKRSGPALAVPVEPLEPGGAVPSWPIPQAPATTNSAPPPPGGPGPRMPWHRFARAGGLDEGGQRRFVPASPGAPASPARADESTLAVGPVIGTFVGSVNGGEVHAIVALGGDSYQTTLLWHDPLGAPHAATVDSGSDSDEEVDLDEDGEPDVMIRPGGCSPQSNAGEPAGDGLSVCVYLRQDAPNESDEQ